LDEIPEVFAGGRHAGTERASVNECAL